MEKLESYIEPLFTGDELIEKLTILPELKTDVVTTNDRLLAILDIYKIFIPNSFTVDIYCRLYLSLVNSLRKKKTVEEVKLYNDVFNGTRGVIGGLDSFRITGFSGVGKTSSIQRCIEVITKNKIISIVEDNRDIIPFLLIECPADGSFKSLLFSILEKIDKTIGTDYFHINKHKSITTDYLMIVVSVVLINHVGVLIIDEVERVANNSVKGTTLINYLTQLVNQTNISICFIGNESCNSYFSLKEYLGRRTVGLNLERLNYDDEFFSFLKKLFEYQYTVEKVKFSSALAQCFYKYSNGTVAILVGLFIESQKYSLLNNEPCINEKIIRITFDTFFGNLKQQCGETNKTYVKREKVINNVTINRVDDNVFYDSLKVANKNLNIFLNILSNKIKIDLVKYDKDLY